MNDKVPVSGISRIAQYGFVAVTVGVIVVILTPREDLPDHKNASRSRPERARVMSAPKLENLQPKGGFEGLMIMQEHPSSVMSHIDGLADRELALELAKEFATEFGGTHLDLLIPWLQRQQDPAIRSELAGILADRWARQDPIGLTEFARELGSDPQAQIARQAVLHALNTSDAVTLLKHLSPDEAASLVDHDHKRLAATAPNEAITILDAAPVTEERQATMESLIARWVGGDNIRWFGDPVSAAKRISAIESDDLRTAAYESLASNWCRKSPSLAASWVGSLPPGQERDSAIVGLVDSLVLTDPEAASQWVREINDKALRASTAGQLTGTEAEGTSEN